ncbi:GAF and ANTAR domain-containing protein [Mumia sp. zg.B17]|uniref:GAF and ANTAR domain-containing protein n=1 Tax=Mumia sp. zg.B17 TaxID=2855446 RepID=UPI001C6E66FC|nr:GAF and ANTAR domain-containing protein [Mumia sp. zg.B17]MBW9207075.1 GAF and ANTAR domain-containing protein [Mumia sp. zg.B17]
MADDVLDLQELTDLAVELHAADSPRATAEQVVKYLCELLEMDHAGVEMLRAGGNFETVAATADVVRRADELQRELDEGPWYSASRDRTLRSNDLAHEARWPRWCAAVTAMDLVSLLAVSLVHDGRRIGMVSLYSEKPRFFFDDDEALAHLLARHAAIALARAEQEVNLTIALDARKLIGQAQGILMERFGLDERRAFEVLKRYSQHHNLKLRLVAERFVATRRLPPAPEASTRTPVDQRQAHPE